MSDWREELLRTAAPLPGSATISCGVVTLGAVAAVVAAWDFGVHGGSFGAADATAFVAAVTAARESGRPLVTLLRSGGTRLPEGMHALVGIPRAVLALRELREAGVPHVSVADHPTTGGVWVAVGSNADVRIAVEGAVVGFSGPRVVAAMTGRPLEAGAGTAAAAWSAGLVDLLVAPEAAGGALSDVLRTLAPDAPGSLSAAVTSAPPDRDGWQQVLESRTASRPSGAALSAGLVTGPVPLRGGDESVTATLGRLDGRRVVVVALAAGRSSMPTPAGYTLLARSARLAGRLDLGLVVLVDTPGADPHRELDGLSPAIHEAMSSVLACRAPTVSIVHGEGGSGGALAGAVTDAVAVGELGWFAALAPEGAAAALRQPLERMAGMMRVTPAELLASGFADACVTTGAEREWAAATLDRLRAVAPAQRLARRRARWAAPLTGPGRSDSS